MFFHPLSLDIELAAWWCRTCLDSR